MRGRRKIFLWWVVFSILNSGVLGSASISAKLWKSDKSFPNGTEAKYLCPACRYDIRFKDEFIGGTTPKFAEFKSYALSTWQNIVNRPKFLQQFERYLQDISEIDELQYIFNSSKASETQVKDAFKELFVAKKVEIFDVIWENQSLRDNVFGPDILKIDAESDFVDLINSIDSKLYNFIKAQ
mgnify:CR=1 FL=1